MENKNKKINWQTIALIILAISLISVTIFAVGKETKEIAEQEPEKVYVGYDDEVELENFSRDEAVLAMQNILVSIDKDIEGKERTVEKRMEALDNDETDMEDVINKETIDKLYLSEEFKKSKFNRQFASSVLLTYHQLIADSADSAVSAEASDAKDVKEFKPVIDEFDDIVYLDNKLKTAHIPLDVFLGENKGIAFEMQYIDGEWKFNPYTSMMSLVMVVNYEGQIEQMFKDQSDTPNEDASKENDEK